LTSALDRSALVEAVGQLRKGLALVTNLPDDLTRVQLELDLQISLGKAMIGTKGYQALETGEAFNRAYSLCEQLDKPPQLVASQGSRGLQPPRQASSKSRR
jgi:hypothetical protein